MGKGDSPKGLLGVESMKPSALPDSKLMSPSSRGHLIPTSSSWTSMTGLFKPPLREERELPRPSNERAPQRMRKTLIQRLRSPMALERAGSEVEKNHLRVPPPSFASKRPMRTCTRGRTEFNLEGSSSTPTSSSPGRWSSIMGLTSKTTSFTCSPPPVSHVSLTQSGATFCLGEPLTSTQSCLGHTLPLTSTQSCLGRVLGSASLIEFCKQLFIQV